MMPSNKITHGKAQAIVFDAPTLQYWAAKRGRGVVQIVGPAWGERDLIELAVAYQSQTDWHKKRPPEI